MAFPYEALTEPATTFTEDDVTLASFSSLFASGLGSTVNHEGTDLEPLLPVGPAAEPQSVEIAQENGSFSEGLLLGRTPDGSKARVSFLDPDRQGMVFEIDPVLLRPARGHLRGQRSFVAGEAVEVYWPLRCTWFSARVVDARPDQSYSVQWTSDGAASGARVAYVSSAQLRPVHSVALGTLVEVRGGNGRPGARGSYYEAKVVEHTEPHQVRVQWACRPGPARDEDSVAVMDEDELLRPHGHVRGERFQIGERVEAYWAREKSWWDATVCGADNSSYTVRWEFDYGDGATQTTRVKTNQVRKPMPIELKRRKKSE
jgi:hypothetical protein